jgi:hypothetical protein
VRRNVVEAQIQALRAAFEAEQVEAERLNTETLTAEEQLVNQRAQIAKHQGANTEPRGARMN